MILIDSSSWIHFFNQTDLKVQRSVGELIRQDQVITCGPVITEVLSGVTKPSEARVLRNHFDLLPFLQLEKEDFYGAAEIRAHLKRKGIRCKTVDTLIACLAVREKIALLHHDADFNRIAKHFPLKVCEGSLGT